MANDSAHTVSRIGPQTRRHIMSNNDIMAHESAIIAGARDTIDLLTTFKPRDRLLLPNIVTELDDILREMPLHGWVDNVTCNEELTHKIRNYAETGRPYRGPQPGVHHAGATKPTNRYLQLYLAKLRSNDLRSQLKAQDRFVGREGNKNVDSEDTPAENEINDEIEEGINDEEQFDDRNGGEANQATISDKLDSDEEEPRRTRTTIAKRTLSQPEVEELKTILFDTRDMVLEGIANARGNHKTSPRGLGEDDLIENIEYGGFTLYPYQREAIGRWEHSIRQRRSAILADEIGLGKTWTTIAVIQRLVDHANATDRSILIGLVLPKNLVKTWTESLRFSKTIRYADYSSPGVRGMSADEIKSAYDLIIIPHGPLVSAYRTMHLRYVHKMAIKEGFAEEVVRLSGKPLNPTASFDEVVLSLDLDQLIIDKAQSIKNPTTFLAQAMRCIPARARVALTSTPLQNDVNEFGALLMFIRNKPFANIGLFRAAFTSKIADSKKLTALTRRTHKLNDAMLSAIRSCVTIRRLKINSFDGVSMAGKVKPYTLTVFEVELSPDIKAHQDEIRDLWDHQWKMRQKLLDRQDKDNGLERPPRIPIRKSIETLMAMLAARQNVIHPLIAGARYNDQDKYDPEEINAAIEEGRVPIDGAALATLRTCDRIAAGDRQRMTQRRIDWLKPFRDPANVNLWMSDRLLGVVTQIITIRNAHFDIAHALPEGPIRRRYIATHKILVFCEYLAALDLIDIGLEQRYIKTMRFDGSVSVNRRDELRKEFEEVGKNFETDLPDSRRVMLITTKAGNEGITLVHATDVLLVAPQWNPSVEAQAFSRPVRPGQESQVNVFKFVSPDSIERRIDLTQRKKCVKIDNVLSDELILENSRTLEMTERDEYVEIMGLERCKTALASDKITLD